MYLTGQINGQPSKIVQIDINQSWVYVSYRLDSDNAIYSIRKEIQDLSTILATNIVIDTTSDLLYSVTGQLNGNPVTVISVKVEDDYAYFCYVYTADNTLRTIRKSIQNYDTILLLNTVYNSTSTTLTTNINILIYGAGSAITTGVKGFIKVPRDLTINSWDLVADVSGSISIDLWKNTYTNFPPTVSDSMITTGTKPGLSNQIKNTGLVSDWTTTTLDADDIILVNVDSATTITKVTLILNIT